MASKQVLKTVIYKDVWDLLEIARELEFPWGGKKMSDEVFLRLKEDIVERDMKLDGYVAESERIRKRLDSMDASAVQAHVQLAQMKLELMDMHLRSEVNAILLRREVGHAEYVRGILVGRYLDRIVAALHPSV